MLDVLTNFSGFKLGKGALARHEKSSGVTKLFFNFARSHFECALIGGRIAECNKQGRKFNRYHQELEITQTLANQRRRQIIGAAATAAISSPLWLSTANAQSALYFPTVGNWNTIDPQSAGLNPDSLASALDYAGRAGSNQVIVLHAGRLLAEQYLDATADTMADVFAVQKGVFSWLFGIAQSRGLIGINDVLSKYLGIGWTQLPPADEQRILVRHLLTMTTGLDDTLAASGQTGVTWHYNNVAYNYFKQALCRHVGVSLNQLTDEWLGKPLAWTHTKWIDRTSLLPNGTPISALMMNARDLARFGLAVQARGRFGNTQVLNDASFLRDSLKPGSEANPAWGYLWWINNQSHYMQAYSPNVIAGTWAPSAPADLYGAQGAREQRLLILPSRSLVIVRIGTKVPAELGNFDDEFLRLLLKGAL